MHSTWEASVAISYKVSAHLPSDPTIPLRTANACAKVPTGMFPAALFVIAQN